MKACYVARRWFKEAHKDGFMRIEIQEMPNAESMHKADAEALLAFLAQVLQDNPNLK